MPGREAQAGPTSPIGRNEAGRPHFAVKALKPMNPPLAAVVAIAENGVIGFNNRLPWHISSDL
ncbi:MAG: dihydrofolate reductase, partial [Methylovirgula sp.]